MFGTIISCIKLLQGDWTALTCFVASIENNVICIISIGAYIASWSILNYSWDLDGQQSCLVRLAILLPKPPEALWPAGITFTTFPAAAAAGQCWTMMPVWHEYGWKLGIGHWTLCCLHICRNELCCMQCHAHMQEWREQQFPQAWQSLALTPCRKSLREASEGLPNDNMKVRTEWTQIQ